MFDLGIRPDRAWLNIDSLLDCVPDVFAELSRKPGSFLVDVKETDDKFILTADLPGINKDMVSINVEDGTMTISCEMDEIKENEGETYRVRERKAGKVSRMFALPEVDTASIEATMKDGILTVTMHKTKPKVQNVEVKVG